MWALTATPLYEVGVVELQKVVWHCTKWSGVCRTVNAALDISDDVLYKACNQQLPAKIARDTREVMAIDQEGVSESNSVNTVTCDIVSVT